MILTNTEAARQLGIAPRTLRDRRHKDAGDNGYRSPHWVELGGKCQGYTQQAIDDWIAYHERKAS